MKKMFFLMALLCLIAIGANAQYTSFQISNTSSCDVYVMLYGTTSGSGCATDYNSSILVIPGTSTVTYSSPATVPGGLTGTGGTLGGGGHFTMVRVLNGPYMYSCFSLSSYLLSDCVAGVPANVTDVQFYGHDVSGCYACPSPGTLYNLWYNPSGTTAKLEIF